jgi:Uma2 family endonuclease
MSVAEFLAWGLRQDERYELVDGDPRLMTGARVSHDRVVVNVLTALRNRLRANGSPCDVFGADIALIVPAGNVRRPDVAVYYPPFDENAAGLDRPSVIVEVLSVSTQDFDQLFKLEEYKAIAGLEAVIFIAPTIRQVGVWSRGADLAWQRVELREEAATIALPGLGVSLPLSEVYERVVFQEATGPRLVWPDSPA